VLFRPRPLLRWHRACGSSRRERSHAIGAAGSLLSGEQISSILTYPFCLVSRVPPIISLRRIRFAPEPPIEANLNCCRRFPAPSVAIGLLISRLRTSIQCWTKLTTHMGRLETGGTRHQTRPGTRQDHGKALCIAQAHSIATRTVPHRQKTGGVAPLHHPRRAAHSSATANE
jgi:hypothetical protein